ncbi:MAG: hypothetical protein K0Q57_552 [Gammaproteobacteria bacterium]|jgi:hypothetical protein|nr:hypothetical protein [Gammaproteobacteria bacterium]
MWYEREFNDERRGWSIAKGTAIVTAIALGIAGTALGVSNRKRLNNNTSPSMPSEPYGMSGLIANGTEFCGRIHITENIYTYGIHGAGNASWEASVYAIPAFSPQCVLDVSGVPMPINATQPGGIEWEVENPTDHRRRADKATFECQGDTAATVFLNHSYTTESGKEVRQQSKIAFNPTICQH